MHGIISSADYYRIRSDSTEQTEQMHPSAEQGRDLLKSSSRKYSEEPNLALITITKRQNKIIQIISPPLRSPELLIRKKKTLFLLPA
jgi:hypothetical protein